MHIYLVNQRQNESKKYFNFSPYHQTCFNTCGNVVDYQYAESRVKNVKDDPGHEMFKLKCKIKIYSAGKLDVIFYVIVFIEQSYYFSSIHKSAIVIKTDRQNWISYNFIPTIVPFFTPLLFYISL